MRSRLRTSGQQSRNSLARSGSVNICIEVTLQKETLASQEDPMNVDVLTTRVADGIAVITLGSAKRIYFDAEMGDALTAALDGYAGDPNIRAVVLTGGAPGYFARHFSITALLQLAE